MPDDVPAGWVRDHLANERTLLAWIRTALAFMAFGVAVAKFGFLLYVAGADHPELRAELPTPPRSELMGVALIVFGGALAVAGTIRTRRWARRIHPALAPPPQRTLRVAALLTAAFAVFLVAYLLA